MPSIKQIFGVVAVGLATVATALPAMPKLNERALKMWESHLMARQDPATGLPDGLGDIDILQLYVPSSSPPSHLITNKNTVP